MTINIIVHSQFKILVAALAVALHRSVQSTFSLHQEAFIISTSLNLALAITHSLTNAANENARNTTSS